MSNNYEPLTLATLEIAMNRIRDKGLDSPMFFNPVLGGEMALLPRKKWLLRWWRIKAYYYRFRYGKAFIGTYMGIPMLRSKNLDVSGELK